MSLNLDAVEYGDQYWNVPCPDCFAHTGEACKPVPLSDVIPIRGPELYLKGHVHPERRAQAERAARKR